MRIKKTYIEGVFVIEPNVYNDTRGFFYEFFNQTKFNELTGLKIQFVQDNLAKSHYGVLRGFHFQKAPNAQSKLVSVIKGAVFDVIIDLRENSKTYGQSFSIELNEQNKKQLFVPKGFAHAYLTLKNDTLFFYKIDHPYHPESETGIRFDDPKLNINWPLNKSDFILSEKDKILPFLQPKSL